MHLKDFKSFHATKFAEFISKNYPRFTFLNPTFIWAVSLFFAGSNSL